MKFSSLSRFAVGLFSLHCSALVFLSGSYARPEPAAPGYHLLGYALSLPDSVRRRRINDYISVDAEARRVRVARHEVGSECR